ncbi:MAG: hypothetical protein ACP5IO_03300 [Elusimicrobiales bacterium]
MAKISVVIATKDEEKNILNWINNRVFLFSIFVFILSRLIFVIKFPAPFDADEAVFGLMGKYISEGKDFPVFMWYAYYSGTISSYIFAIFIKVFGFKPILLKITMMLWEVIGVMFFSLLFNYPIRSLIPLFMIMPFKYDFLYPSYLECFTIGFALFYIVKKIYNGNNSKRLIFLSGFLNGFGLYHQPLFIPFFLTSLVLSVKFLKEFKNRIWFEIGFVLGLLPLILYNLLNDFATVGRLGGIVIGGIKGSVNFVMLFKNIFNTFGLSFILTVFFSLIILLYFRRYSFSRKLFLTLFIVSLIFYFSPGVRKTRYLMPFFYGSIGLVTLSFECLKDIKARLLLSSVFVIISTYNFSTFIKDITYPDFNSLVDFLNEKQIKHCYSDYWTAYPITFLSNENIIVSPRMNDRMGFYDRTPHYYQNLKNSKDKCFIIPFNLSYVYDILVMRLKKMKVGFKEYKVADNYIIMFRYEGDDSVFLI